MDKESIISLLTTNVCLISFNKKNGIKREMVCTRMPSKLPPKKEPSESGSSSPKPENIIVVWDLEKDGWRSFDLESVLTIEVKKEW